jgi:hypothetical protein
MRLIFVSRETKCTSIAPLVPQRTVHSGSDHWRIGRSRVDDVVWRSRCMHRGELRRHSRDLRAFPAASESPRRLCSFSGSISAQGVPPAFLLPFFSRNWILVGSRGLSPVRNVEYFSFLLLGSIVCGALGMCFDGVSRRIVLIILIFFFLRFCGRIL